MVSILFYFYGLLVRHALKDSRTDHIKSIFSQLQPTRFKYLVEAYSCDKRNNSNSQQLANDAFYFIHSFIFQCMEYYWTMKEKQKFLFIIFGSVSWANTAVVFNINAVSLFHMLMFQEASFTWVAVADSGLHAWPNYNNK